MAMWESVKICTLDGCERHLIAKGLCSRHYQKMVRYGDPAHEAIAPGAVRLWSRITKGINPDDCWIWTGTADGGNYGVLAIDGVRHKTHRLAYELLVGPIPDGYDLDHQCHNRTDCKGGKTCLHRRCANPSHLEPVTRSVNLSRSSNLAWSNGNKAKTHCKHGHEFAGENLIILPGEVGRACRACRRITDRRTKDKRMAERDARS